MSVPATYEPNSNRTATLDGVSVVLDANGNTTSLRGMRLGYTADNRLKSAGGADYAYTAQGARAKKTVSGTTTLFVYGPSGKLLAETDDTGQVLREYLYAGETLFALDDQTALYSVHSDRLGTPKALTDETGIVVWSAEHHAFGAVTVDEDPDGDHESITFNVRFPGQYFDAETGLNYNLNRTYDSSTGRYIESDPIGLDGGLNTYLYAEANPLTYVDPLGLFSSLELCKNPRNYEVCTAAGMAPKNPPKPVLAPIPLPKEKCDDGDDDDPCDKKLTDQFLKQLGIDAHAIKREMVPGGGWGKYNLCGCKDGRIVLKVGDCKWPGGDDTGESWK